MATQTISIYRTNTNSTDTNNKNDIWSDPFDFTPSHNENNWLSQSFKSRISTRKNILMI